jgi:hypothetical protein
MAAPLSPLISELLNDALRFTTSSSVLRLTVTPSVFLEIIIAADGTMQPSSPNNFIERFARAWTQVECLLWSHSDREDPAYGCNVTFARGGTLSYDSSTCSFTPWNQHEALLRFPRFSSTTAPEPGIQYCQWG